jgi:hypothetical protein
MLSRKFPPRTTHGHLSFLYRESFQHVKWKTNRCHYFNFIHISTDLYMFRAYRPILRRIHTSVHTTIGSMAVLFGPRALYVVAGLGDCSLLVEIRRYINKIRIVTSVGFSFYIPMDVHLNCTSHCFWLGFHVNAKSHNKYLNAFIPNYILYLVTKYLVQRS